MSAVNFCYENAEAAKVGTETSPNAKVFKVNKGDVVKFVVAANKDLAISRFASEVLEVAAVRDGKKPRGGGSGSAHPRVSKKHIDEMLSKAADAATPEEAHQLLKEAKSLSQQLEERRAAKKAAKANGAPPAPPTP